MDFLRGVEGSYYAKDFENDINIEAKVVIEVGGSFDISMVELLFIDKKQGD